MSHELAVQAQGLEGWQRSLEANPDVLMRIIRDMAKIIQSGDRTGVTGRRPSPKAVSFDELWSMLFPERFSNEPFHVTLVTVMNGRSQNYFAKQMHVGQSHLHYLLRGSRKPSIEVMEAAAKAGRTSPAVFVEWRAMKLGQLVTEVLLQRPDVSTQIVKALVKL